MAMKVRQTWEGRAMGLLAGIALNVGRDPRDNSILH